jgi:hypothetical protein
MIGQESVRFNNLCFQKGVHVLCILTRGTRPPPGGARLLARELLTSGRPVL